MQIIPVIDLKDGQVVHAVRGDRNRYQPVHLSSVLSAYSSLTAVMTGILKLYPFDKFYIADLNAIGGNGDHSRLIENLLNEYPEICFWIDNGSQLSGIQAKTLPNYKAVIGTESQQSQPYRENREFILSLDFKQGQACGDPAWFQESSFWPQEIIVMTLNRVGSNNGPDFQKLAALSTAYPARTWVAAGGIRHRNDLIRLDEMGISAALLATALHNGSLSGEEVREIHAGLS